MTSRITPGTTRSATARQPRADAAPKIGLALTTPSR